MSLRRSARAALIAGTLTAGIAWSAAPAAAERLQLLDGVYRTVPNDTRVARGGANQGDPELLHERPESRVPDTGAASTLDPYKLCQAIGPFRMMAQSKLKLELVAASDRLVMLFEDTAHGYLRSLYLGRDHPADFKPHYAFQGDSVARWQGDDLVIDTVGFNDRTWLNGHVKASDALHLQERIHPLAGGRYLEYHMTAKDPKSLARPYSYVRYFERIEEPIQQNVCEIDSDWSPEKGF